MAPLAASWQTVTTGHVSDTAGSLDAIFPVSPKFGVPPAARRDRDLPGFSMRHGFEVLVISSRWECTIVYHGDRGRVYSFPLCHCPVSVRGALGTSIYPGMDGGSMTANCFDGVHVGHRRIPPCKIASITDVLSAATWDTHAIVRHIALRFDVGFAVYHTTYQIEVCPNNANQHTWARTKCRPAHLGHQDHEQWNRGSRSPRSRVVSMGLPSRPMFVLIAPGVWLL